MDTDIHVRCVELRARSARVRADVALMQNEYSQKIEQIALRRTTAPATGGAIYNAPPPSPHDLAIEALHLIRTIIDPFPIEWQVAIVKALTARTLVKAHERTQPAQAVISA